MCLYTGQRVPKIAESSIRCMKVVRKKANGSYSSLFCVTHNDIVFYCVGNETKIRYYEKDNFVAPLNCESLIDVITGEFFRVENGLHSYTINNRNAVSLAKKGFARQEVALLECEIPVGALYYEGHSNVFHCPIEEGFETETSYCSDRLLVIREVPLSELEDIFGNETGGEKCV